MKDKLVQDLLKDLTRVSEGVCFNDADDYGDYWVPSKDGRGVPFAGLSARTQGDVLWRGIDWQSYFRRGLTSEEAEIIVGNIVVEDLPRERWLEGTGLAEPTREYQRSEQSLDDLQKAAAVQAAQAGEQKGLGK